MQNQNKRSPIRSTLVAGLVLVTLWVSACATAVIAVGAITTLDIIHDRRSVGEYVDDQAIELKTRSYLLSSKTLRSTTNVRATSWNGIVLLTGEVADEGIKQQVVQKAGSFQGVRQVVDETVILGKSKLRERTNDAWISGKIKSSMIRRMGLTANRIKVVTSRTAVYLLGIVTPDEADRATEIARTVRGVSRVVRVFEITDGTPPAPPPSRVTQ